MMTMPDAHEVRFTGGPFSWRKRYGPDFRIRLLDTTQRLEVPGRVRGVRRDFRTRDEWARYMKTHRAEYSIGVYERVAPDRFKWRGWQDADN